MAGKRTESDTGRKNAQEVMINITMVKFAQITDYGTYHAIFYHRSEALYCPRCGGQMKIISFIK